MALPAFSLGWMLDVSCFPRRGPALLTETFQAEKSPDFVHGKRGSELAPGGLGLGTPLIRLWLPHPLICKEKRSAGVLTRGVVEHPAPPRSTPSGLPVTLKGKAPPRAPLGVAWVTVSPCEWTGTHLGFLSGLQVPSCAQHSLLAGWRQHQSARFTQACEFFPASLRNPHHLLGRQQVE